VTGASNNRRALTLNTEPSRTEKQRGCRTDQRARQDRVHNSVAQRAMQILKTLVGSMCLNAVLAGLLIMPYAVIGLEAGLQAISTQGKTSLQFV